MTEQRCTLDARCRKRDGHAGVCGIACDKNDWCHKLSGHTGACLKRMRPAARNPNPKQHPHPDFTCTRCNKMFANLGALKSHSNWCRPSASEATPYAPDATSDATPDANPGAQAEAQASPSSPPYHFTVEIAAPSLEVATRQLLQTPGVRSVASSRTRSDDTTIVDAVEVHSSLDDDGVVTRSGDAHLTAGIHYRLNATRQRLRNFKACEMPFAVSEADTRFVEAIRRKEQAVSDRRKAQMSVMRAGLKALKGIGSIKAAQQQLRNIDEGHGMTTETARLHDDMSTIMDELLSNELMLHDAEENAEVCRCADEVARADAALRAAVEGVSPWLLYAADRVTLQNMAQTVADDSHALSPASAEGEGA